MKSYFDIPSDVVYLNAAYAAPMPKPGAEAARASIEMRTSRFWEMTPKDFFTGTEELRGLVGKLWGVSANNIAIVPSVSYGVETAVLNLPLKAGDEVVMPEGDFPSDVYPWREACKRAGATILTVAKPVDCDWTSAVLATMSERTRVLSVPYSDWSDGTKFDLPTLSRECKLRGAALVVDVSQSFGGAPVHLPDFDADFVFSVGYKWQCGPYGLAFLYVADRWLEGRPLENNWINREASEDFAGLLNYRDTFQPGARRFDSGQRSHFHLTPIAKAGLGMLAEVGIDKIFANNSALVRALYDGFKERGFELAPWERLAGHMLGARHPKIPDMSPTTRKLAEQKIFVSARGSALRVSPHLYNDAGDVERLFKALDRN